MRALAHSESDFIPYVLACMIQNDGDASFPELRTYIEDNFPLNQADRRPLPSLGCPTWHQRVRNLKSNKTMLMNVVGVREVPFGFRLNKRCRH